MHMCTVRKERAEQCVSSGDWDLLAEIITGVILWAWHIYIHITLLVCSYKVGVVSLGSESEKLINI